MHYTKPPLNFHNQAALLLNRGLEADMEELKSFLGKVNYYRFSGYLFPFRIHESDQFLPGTTFSLVKQIYDFDTHLRLLTFATIEIIDIAILRTMVVEKFSLEYGAFCYTSVKNFNKLTPNAHQQLMEEIQTMVKRSKEEFVINYSTKYCHEKNLPFWMIAELSSFGLLSRMYEFLPNNVKVPIAQQFNLHSNALGSWLHMLSTIRNICAHHARLWNRILPVKPQLPPQKYVPMFYEPEPIQNNRYFVVAAILNYLLSHIDKENTYLQDFRQLISNFSKVPFQNIGLPNDWHDYSIFQMKKL